MQPTRVPPEVVARRLLAYEAGSGTDSPALAEAAEHACERLRARLAPRLGAEGFQQMLARTLHLAARQYAFLGSVELPLSNGCFGGLAEALRGREHDEARESLVVVFAGLFRLLTALIGEELTLRMLRKSWPEIDWDDDARQESAG